MKSIVKGAIAILATFAIIGCGDYTRTDGSGNTDNSFTDNSTTDNSATDNSQGSGADGTVDANKTTDIEEGIYRQDYTPQECTAAGFFYCTIEDMCLDTPKATGTCNG